MKAEEKQEIDLIKDFGPEGDAYGGPGERQITLLGFDDKKILEKDREKGICIKRFVPNLTISGSSKELIKGKRYSLGDCEIQISNESKKCHEGCPLREEKNRICLLPSTARFASIIKSGHVSIKNEIQEI
jgi:MOSC domain-containing protein YiiM